MTKKLFVPLALVTAAMFAYAPYGINNIALQSTMLLVQKIFYFHMATWMAMTLVIAICGVSSLISLRTMPSRATRCRQPFIIRG